MKKKKIWVAFFNWSSDPKKIDFVPHNTSSEYKVVREIADNGDYDPEMDGDMYDWVMERAILFPATAYIKNAKSKNVFLAVHNYAIKGGPPKLRR